MTKVFEHQLDLRPLLDGIAENWGEPRIGPPDGNGVIIGGGKVRWAYVWFPRSPVNGGMPNHGFNIDREGTGWEIEAWAHCVNARATYRSRVEPGHALVGAVTDMAWQTCGCSKAD